MSILGLPYVRNKILNFDVHANVHRGKFLITEPNRCVKFSKFLFWNETLHVSDGSSVNHQEFSTDGTQFHPNPARKLSANLYDIYHCCVYSGKLLMMERGTVRNMYSFISK